MIFGLAILAPFVPFSVMYTTLFIGSHTLHVRQGQSLARAIWLSGHFAPPPLCSGLGRCGLCRVHFRALSVPPDALETEKDILTPQEIHEGWRLACHHRIENLPREVDLALPEHAPPPTLSIHNTVSSPYFLMAVDLGTTSLQWRVLHPTGDVFAEGQEINPQMGAGSDILSRLAVAQDPQQCAQLARLVWQALQRIVTALPAPVKQICLAANTAMTAIVLQKDVRTLAAAPYALPLAGDMLVNVDCETLLPPVYIPPLPAPFVGGDISAGFAALQERGLHYPFLFADLGTNGEYILGVDAQTHWLASVPLGPALEGIGLTYGGMAAPGVVTKFALTPLGLQAYTLDERMYTYDDISPTPQTRISGTGYLSLIHILRRAGIIYEDGIFQHNDKIPLARSLSKHLHTYKEHTRFALPVGMYLTARDVEEVLKVKAAFSLAIEMLLHAAECPVKHLRHIYLAGALGNHVSPLDLEGLGFIPAGSAGRVVPVGNTALAGAEVLLLHPERRAALAQWAATCRLLPITHNPDFMTTFVRHMRFA